MSTQREQWDAVCDMLMTSYGAACLRITHEPNWSIIVALLPQSLLGSVPGLQTTESTLTATATIDQYLHVQSTSPELAQRLKTSIARLLLAVFPLPLTTTSVSL